MTRPDRMTSRHGATLIEVLVALVVVALAVAGTSQLLQTSLWSIEDARAEAAALRELNYRLDLAEAGQGSAVLPSGQPLDWTVNQESVASRTIAGTEMRWIRLSGEVRWVSRGRERRMASERLIILPGDGTDTRSPS
ncbi:MULTISPECIES: prepilin-type N-terminal cleavage/methylation domain-containing protein [Hyphobacterium]|uniref:Prepilin-type N-terminal cleavage/methylation domain-containing protein n=1 Tax=Hyphobacterium vulgare TaxID=1736751 RepID=A0ABV6ZX09_9PROT